jgi:predicted ester cyclase
MDPHFAETTTTFVLRFRREWTGAEGRWRGRIEHVQSGRRSDFLGLGELLGFLEQYGIRAGAETGEQRRSGAGATSGGDGEGSRNRVESPTIHTKESIMSTPAENKAMLDRFMVELNKGNLDIVYEFIAPEFVGHSPSLPEPIRGPDGFKAFLLMLGTAMPDAHYPSWTLIADGDLVAIHMLFEGTFTNELMGIPPNGKKITAWNANIWRFENGKLVEWWQNLDTLGFMQQLGAIPPLG